MNFFEIVLTLAISLGAVVWGVNIYNQKGTWFLAGWNTMSKEEKATYNEKEVAVVDCKTTVRGMRNDQAFEKIYTMQMVVNYQTNVVSVYEVEDITWE